MLGEMKTLVDVAGLMRTMEIPHADMRNTWAHLSAIIARDR
jgi:hypothetical protein